MPESFEFPQLDALGSSVFYPPFRSLHSSEFATSSRKMFSEWSVLVMHVTTAIETSTGTKIQRPKTQD
ncbi:hypothetical protein PHMEG_00034227 [Phytophthora megakarya]|uniref:Uncharacterized protein n=1 Tax=Phytophthora megakarya TaxID=4795 RepID=A0A225URZ7_9STRA|nr:hypothetical protein PHMEG_00034227 [Phytophthora megakarya]